MELIKPTKRFDNELSVVSAPFDFTNPPFDPKSFSEALAKKMIRENGIGLAAIQIGMPYRVFVVRTDPVYVCFNPKIVDLGGEENIMEEGCLSFPGMSVKVKRFDELRLRFQNHDGQFATRKFAGLAARVIQHEYDHLNGILFYNRASRYHRDAALKKWERTLVKKSAPINTQKENV
jgi:peptide deformylase